MHWLDWDARQRISRVCRIAANPHSMVGDDEELIQTIGILAEDVVEPTDFAFQRFLTETNQDDATVGSVLPEYQLSEVPVIGDQDAPLSGRDGQNVIIGEGIGIVVGNGRDVVPHCSKVDC